MERNVTDMCLAASDSAVVTKTIADAIPENIAAAMAESDGAADNIDISEAEIDAVLEGRICPLANERDPLDPLSCNLTLGVLMSMVKDAAAFNVGGFQKDTDTLRFQVPLHCTLRELMQPPKPQP
jgi:hypothetical protein